jgi:hypothetical protein
MDIQSKQELCKQVVEERKVFLARGWASAGHRLLSSQANRISLWSECCSRVALWLRLCVKDELFHYMSLAVRVVSLN